MSADVYAVIRTGGKQHRISPGQRLRVERLPGEVGDRITFDDVLMVNGGGEVSVGSPVLDGASVTAEVVGQTRARKINVFKYKAKTRYRRLRGHRQLQTDLRIAEISLGEQTWSAPARPAPATEEAAVEEAAAESDEAADVAADEQADETPVGEQAADAPAEEPEAGGEDGEKE